MATLDQLSAEQRAIVELVVQRGRSYDALADVLQVPSARVQELARDALVELSPVTARRVDREWRGPVADYLLGQQSSTDSRETRDHLKGSEAARSWALSLIDSLDPLYGDATRPAVPEPEKATPERTRTRDDTTRAGTATLEERVRERERDRERPPRKLDRERTADRKRDRKPESDRKPGGTVKRAGSLSPAAEAALKRRRLIGAAGGLAGLAVIVVVILAITGAFSGDDANSKSKASSASAASGASTNAAAGNEQPQVLGQIALKPQNGAKAQGAAYLVQVAGKPYLVVQAKLPPLQSNQQKFAYEVWLYNSKTDAKSVGAQYTDAQGNYQGRQELPADFASKYKFVDVTREPFDNDAGNSGNSVLRGAFADLKQVQQPEQGATPAPDGTGTTP
jgi:hypothetical protein